MKRARVPLLIIMAGLIILFYFQFDLAQYLNIEFIKAKHAVLNSYYSTHPYITAVVFFLTFVVLVGLSLPAAGIMMIAGGVIFGLLWGIIIVSFAYAIGSTIAFLASRYLFRDLVMNRYSDKIQSINKGIELDGFFYLLLIRQVPVLPSFLVNILMGLTPISLTNFYLATQIGVFGFVVIFVNAGTQIATITEPADILSARLIISFMLVGMFPLLAKKTILYIKKRRQLAEINPDLQQ